MTLRVCKAECRVLKLFVARMVCVWYNIRELKARVYEFGKIHDTTRAIIRLSKGEGGIYELYKIFD